MAQTVTLKNVDRIVSSNGTVLNIDSVASTMPASVATAGTAADGHSDSASHFYRTTTSNNTTYLHSFASCAAAVANGLSHPTEYHRAYASTSNGTHSLHAYGGPNPTVTSLKSFSSNADGITWGTGLLAYNQGEAIGMCSNGTDAMAMGSGGWGSNFNTFGTIRKISMVTLENGVSIGSMLERVQSGRQAASNGTIALIETGRYYYSNNWWAGDLVQGKAFDSSATFVRALPLMKRYAFGATSDGLNAYFGAGRTIVDGNSANYNIKYSFEGSSSGVWLGKLGSHSSSDVRGASSGTELAWVDGTNKISKYSPSSDSWSAQETSTPTLAQNMYMYGHGVGSGTP